MSNDSWKKGQKDVQQNKGPVSPSIHKTDQAKKSYEAGRSEAEKRRINHRHEEPSFLRTPARFFNSTAYRAQLSYELRIDLLWQTMKVRQTHERKVMLAHIVAERRKILARRQWKAAGPALYLRKLAVLREILRHYAQQQGRRKLTQEEVLRGVEAAMRKRHKSEAAEIERSYEVLRRLDWHELKSL